jgi:hypothetical protein
MKVKLQKEILDAIEIQVASGTGILLLERMPVFVDLRNFGGIGFKIQLPQAPVFDKILDVNRCLPGAWFAARLHTFTFFINQSLVVLAHPVPCLSYQSLALHWYFKLSQNWHSTFCPLKYLNCHMHLSLSGT